MLFSTMLIDAVIKIYYTYMVNYKDKIILSVSE